MSKSPTLRDVAMNSKPIRGALDVGRTLSLAEKFAFNHQKPDGHWCAEFRASVYPTGQYVIFYQAWGIDLSADVSQLCKHILSLQTPDGSWSIAPDYPGDNSATAEAYLALRILGYETTSKELLRARDFIRNAGGLAKIRILTRFLLAQFGLFPWKAVPQLAPELVLLPVWSPINCFSIPFWARHVLLPLAVMRHHEPIFALPNGKSATNSFLDELWLDPLHKFVPYRRPLFELLVSDPIAAAFTVADQPAQAFNVLRYNPLRYLARKQTIEWLLQHQEKDGSWSGYLLAGQCTMTALLLEGASIDETPVRRGLAAMETWAVEDDAGGKRLQMTTSPTWDTALMIEALCISGTRRDDDRLKRAAEWIKARQLFGPNNDVAQYCPDLHVGGGWAFQYENSWVPDIDDTAAVALSLVAQDPSALDKYWFVCAAEWTLGMQNRDHGWASFERNCDHQWLNKCRPPAHLVRRAQRAVPGAIRFIASKQEADGSWWCRWGVNYVLGTSQALNALAPYVEPSGQGLIADMVRRGVTFITDHQHADGGWGETVASYDLPPGPKCQGPSLPSSTGWALLGLLGAEVDPKEPVVQRGVGWLVREQTDTDDAGGASWPQRQYTGTAFPGKLYLGYKFYRHYFPMLALGKYMRALKGVSKDRDEKIALPS